jgi:hypothetical protein
VEKLVSCESLCLLESWPKVRTNFLRKVETRIVFLRAVLSLARILRRYKLSQLVKWGRVGKLDTQTVQKFWFSPKRTRIIFPFEAFF